MGRGPGAGLLGGGAEEGGEGEGGEGERSVRDYHMSLQFTKL